jgi:hypothetical protein
MNWMLFSAEALLIAVGGPLLMVESVPVVRALSALDRRRRTRRAWTGVALVLAGIYLGLDRVAISAGTRSLVVLILAVGFFLALLVALGYPILHDAARAERPPSGPREAAPPLLGFPWDIPVLLVLLAGLAAFAVSPNDLGYRIKGAGIVVGGGALYLLGRPRARLTFFLCAISGTLTLFVHWQVPWQRALRAFGQLTVGIVGLVWCAHLIVRMAGESGSSREAA